MQDKTDNYHKLSRCKALLTSISSIVSVLCSKRATLLMSGNLDLRRSFSVKEKKTRKMMFQMNVGWKNLLLVALLLPLVSSWTSSPSRSQQQVSFPRQLSLQLSTPASSSGSDTQQKQQQQQQVQLPDEEFYRDATKVSSEDWELDCYSRPVVVGGKKLWEVLITDSTGSFRYCKRLPSANVNSKTVRQVVEALMDSTEVTRPSTIRFFRGAMFNMINIALSELEVERRPSRCTYILADWLEERHRNVYPKMEGYRATMVSSALGGNILDVRTPVKLPDALRGESYAFVALPLAEFQPPPLGSISRENIGVGRLCPVDMSRATGGAAAAGDVFVHGIVIMTPRAKALASWLAGTELYALKSDLRKRTITIETDIDTSYLMAKLRDDSQREEAAAMEESKDRLGGLHFVSVQRDENDEEPAGFWLLRDVPDGI